MRQKPSERAAKTEGVGVFAESGDAKGDVFVERNAEFFGAFDDIFAADAASERFVFHAFFHRADFQVQNAFRWTYISASSEKSRQFVASKQGVFERALPSNARIFRVRKNRANQ